MYKTSLLASNILRITHVPPGSSLNPDRPWLKDILLPLGQTEPSMPPLYVEDAAACPQIYTPEGTWLCGETAPPQLEEHHTQFDISVDIPKVEIRPHLRRVRHGIRLKIKTLPGESFYGFGEWFNVFRRQSGTVEMNIRDAIAMIQAKETYSAIPCFISSRGYAFFLINSHASRWHIQPVKGILEISAAGPAADYIVIYGPSIKEIIYSWTALTGRPPLLPRWAFGLFVTGYPQEHQAVIQERLLQHRQHRIPLDAVILDYHWEEKYHNFEWRTSLFPQPDSFIAELANLGLRLGLITTPFINAKQHPFQKFFLNSLAANLPPGSEQDDENPVQLFEQGSQAGYFAHSNARWWFGTGGMLDFTNPKASRWWNDLLRPRYLQGAAFFKNDDGEYLPEDATSHMGITGSELHNLYGFYYGRAMYEGMLDLPSEKSPRRPFIYARSVWAGSQRFPAVFLGDQKPTFEHIQRTLRAGLNLGLLGFAYWTADVFGLDGKTTLETHMRYAQWALLNPVARYFWRPPLVDDTRFPWSHGTEAEDNFRRYTELRYQLLPYYQTLAWQAWQTGLPIIRPLLLEYPGDPRFADLTDQYLLGPDLLVAPVVEAQATSRSILLPEGTWHDYWGSQTYNGPAQIDYSAPLERLPILARGGCLVPCGPLMQNIPENHTFNTLELHAWPPYSARLEFFDDDGLTIAYQNGNYSTTLYTLETASRSAPEKSATTRLLFTAHPTQGGFPEQTAERQVSLILHRCPPPTSIQLNNQPLTAWEYNSQLSELLVRFICPQNTTTYLGIEITTKS